ncbi:hypothetical protein ABEW05_007220 [Botrytis cinerea]
MIVQETQSEENAYFFNTEFNGILLEFDLFVKKTEEVPERTFDGDMLECMRDSLVWQKLCLLPHPSSFTNFDLPFPSSLLQSIEHLAIHVESKGKEKATVTEDVIAHDASQAKLSDAVAEGFATQSIEAQDDKTLWLGLECCHCYK